jgi:16S rRNA (uracil1498-N3)-methyltransferase
MADRFYVSFPLAPSRVVLHGPEAHHLATVMRARPGDAICLFNGDGAEYSATVVEVGKKSATLSVGGAQWLDRELGFQLEVAAPLPKGDRGDFLIEKLTELGVTRFVPLRTQRSIVHPRLERLRRTVIEASKQCRRNRLMGIEAVVGWEEYCRPQHQETLRFLAHPDGQPLAETLIHLLPVTWSEQEQPSGRRANWAAGVKIAVGPEGGWTDAEVNDALSNGWRSVALGPRILRVETAAVALAAYFAAASA